MILCDTLQLQNPEMLDIKELHHPLIIPIVVYHLVTHEDCTLNLQWNTSRDIQFEETNRLPLIYNTLKLLTTSSFFRFSIPTSRGANARLFLPNTLFGVPERHDLNCLQNQYRLLF